MKGMLSVAALLAAVALGVAVASAPVTVVEAAAAALLVVLLIRARRSLRPQALNVRQLAPELVALPTVVSLDDAHQRIALVLLAGLFGVAATRKPRRVMPLTGRALMPLVLFAGSTLLVYRDGPYSEALVVALAFLVLAASAQKNETTTALDSLTLGLCAYLAANIAGHYAGMVSPAASVRIGGYESSSSLFVERIIFPFTSSIQEAAIGAAVLLVLLLTRRLTNLRAVRWAGFAAAVFVMLAGNSRFPMAVAFIVALGFLTAPRLTRKVGPRGVPLAMALPFFVALISPVLLWLAEGVVDSSAYLARGQTAADIAGIGTRVDIWTGGLYWYDARVHGFDQWFGYGQFGHATSGAYGTYAAQFGGFLTDPRALSLHNTLLQQLYDGGILGLGLFVAALAIVLRRYSRSHNPSGAGAALTLCLCAVTEVTLTPGFATTPFFLLMALAAWAPLRDEADFGRRRDDRNGDIHIPAGSSVGASNLRYRNRLVEAQPR